MASTDAEDTLVECSLVPLGFSLFLPDLGGGGSVLLGFFSRGSSVEVGGAGLAALAAATSSGLPDPNSAGISPVYTPRRIPSGARAPSQREPCCLTLNKHFFVCSQPPLHLSHMAVALQVPLRKPPAQEAEVEVSRLVLCSSGPWQLHTAGGDR